MSMKKRDIARATDPHREREASRYEHPIPSREFILQTLAEAGVPLTDEELARRLAIKPMERDAFVKRLGAMERDGQILRNRKGAILVASKLDLIKGRVEGHPDGYGFVIAEEGEDLYLGPHEMRKVLHGDRVMVRESGVDRRGRREGTIVEVIERANTQVVGRLVAERKFLFVQPAERRISQTILIAPEDVGNARAGQVVVAELTAQPDGHTQPIGRVVEVLGEAADSGIEIEIALRKHELPFKFSAQAEALAAKFPPVPRPGDLAGREDLRSLELVTIDGETARDFDDAVYCEKTGGGLLRAGRRRSRSGGARARQLGLLSPPRHSDASRAALERPVLAQRGSRPLVHGLRHGDRRQGRDRPLSLLSCGDALAR